MATFLPSDSVIEHIIDVHCHPTDSEVTTSSMDALKIKICAMASRSTDQKLVRELAEKYPEKVTPCFGYHPWFVAAVALDSASSKEEHYRAMLSPEDTSEFGRLFPLLPEPILLQDVLRDLRQNLTAFPNAMLGEVGLDRAFRIPFDYYAEPRELSSFTVPITHQVAILEAQLELAVELGRNVSFHSVKAGSNTLNLLNEMSTKHGGRWRNISIDMHSCGLSPQMWQDIQKKHPNVFLSLSTVINSRSANHVALIKCCSANRILVESDYNRVEKCTEMTLTMLQTVAQVKGWKIETEWVDDLPEEEWGAVRRLEENWKIFKRGQHAELRTKRKQKQEQVEWDSD
ncbi:TatD DNase family Scn1 [Mycena floridula]|nr:TatD DNase family Scn1 [Mycena floridula]